ncbi:ScbA/BarX family gamma-butyrolactone biosynthesis protein [Streptomyces monticola]|uniref:ScbA/BarX family gamma-butyrolactone biosynthesis protein n=1 Tax=Streptomyces monticola TaxID=2666263 RepID=A0ABW2JYW8_9ACTN
MNRATRTTSYPDNLCLDTEQFEAPTVAKEIVHRSTSGDVMPVRWLRRDDTHFSLGVQWPVNHRFYAPLHGKYSPTLVPETFRQAAILLAHAEFHVPADHTFLISELTYTANPILLRLGTPTTDLTLDVTCSRIRRRGTGIGGMVCQMTLHNGVGVIASGGGRLQCTAPEVYRRIRGIRITAEPDDMPVSPPIDPRRVHRVDPVDVVLAPSARARRWQLRADPRNETLFDHTVDHIPGMVLLEAAHQAAQATVFPRSWYPTSVDICYQRYAEFNSPCWIEVDTAPPLSPGIVPLRVTGHQDGRSVFTALVNGSVT